MNKILCAVAAALISSTAAYAQPISESEEFDNLQPAQQAVVNYANAHYVIDITRTDGTTLTPADIEFKMLSMHLAECNILGMEALRKEQIHTDLELATGKVRCLQAASNEDGFSLKFTLSQR